MPKSPRSEGSANEVPVDPSTESPKSGENAVVVEERKWTSLFTKNRATANGLSLDYLPPQMLNGKPIVHLDKDEVNQEIKKWSTALIAYFIGDVLGYNALTRYITQFWSNVATPQLYYHEEGYYVIRFRSTEDMNEIFYSGPYTINNRPIILKLWTVDFDFSKEFPTTIPLLVKFPKLLMSCWGKGSLSRIASVIGVLIHADECTAKQTRISYVRMLIEVNVTQPLPDKIAVMDPHEKVFEQEVLYNWKPKFCPKFSMVGHV
ncbi:uncharacterized protein LOC129870258 [Solanum dulcamara]|uniref:uncharacterized protein LOC129870258 n=1 Tax=Solanum dulcamara TaxID=45834 RepID=UPI002485E965|nr:uncharacterized protein LOC129870258 [Solanum dulcamara]